MYAIRSYYGEDLTSATVKRIYYSKPSGSTGFFTATVTDEANGVMEYNVASEDDLDEPGTWKFQAFATFSDSRSAYGETFERRIYALFT